MIEDILYTLRKRKGYTQKEIAKMLNIAQTTYSGYENGRRQINMQLLKKISEIYEISIDQLLENKKYKTTEINDMEIKNDIDATLIKQIEELNDKQKKRLIKVIRAIFQE